MDKKTPGGLTSRQAAAICFVALLPPATRLLPGLCADISGRAAWLCPLAALPFLLLTAWLVKKLAMNAAEDENLGALIKRGLGPYAGAAVLIIYAVWLAFYAGFSLRSSASRFIYTIYPGAPPWPFVASGLIMGLIAALSKTRALARASELFRWTLVLALVPILLLGILEMDVKSLGPVYLSDALPVLEGALPALGAGAFLIVNIGFLDRGPGSLRRGRFSAFSCVLMALIVAVTVGRFGHELTAQLTYPFFALVRNTSLSGVSVRIEALVTALWVFSDFVLFTFALSAAADCLRLSFGCGNAKWTIWLCALLAGVTAVLIAPDSVILRLVSELIAPGLNLVMLYGLILPALLIGRIRGRI